VSSRRKPFGRGEAVAAQLLVGSTWTHAEYSDPHGNTGWHWVMVGDRDFVVPSRYIRKRSVTK
jgi:hypothetical protein